MIKYLLRFAFALSSSAYIFLCAQPRTLRVDYYHTGTAKTEFFSIDRMVLEPLPWPGNMEKSLDGSNLGDYFFEVFDLASNRPIYSRGFCSIFGEWATTAEALSQTRTFSESLRFPMPTGKVRVVLKKRDSQNKFIEAWSFNLDPEDFFIDRASTQPISQLIAFQKSGDSNRKVDLLILGDGYTAPERAKFERDANRLLEKLFEVEPLKTNKDKFNVWGLCPTSAQSGIAIPSALQSRKSALGFSFDAFGTSRYVLSYDNRAIMEAASHAPWEFMIVLANNKEYGGGGIFGLYAVSTVDHPLSPTVLVHEFAHHFAGIADEYYLGSVAYLPASPTVEPWEPNITIDPNNPKWKSLISPGTLLPTPWKKDEFEGSGRNRTTPQALRALIEPDTKIVGAFEGANYARSGWYRAEVECLMFDSTGNNEVGFCAACRSAIETNIKNYID
ncbi:MAG: IgA Peptidase M64 [Holophagaceae bacterium]|nr:IgA Peptidase M64 [Holophagaceae bacterium]